jgi:hypothetical protein
VLGGLPVLGRLFTSPTRDDRQLDIVIAVTPRVLRAPAITPDDEEMRPSGTYTSPTNGSLAEMIREDDREQQIAAVPSFVPAPRSLVSDRGAAEVATLNSSNTVLTSLSAKSLQATSRVVQIGFLPADDVLRVGDKRRYTVQVNSDVAVNLAVLSIRFDPKVVKVSSITSASAAPMVHSIDPTGVCLISISEIRGDGALILIDIEAVGRGIASLSFDRESINLIAVDGSDLRTEISNWRALIH